MKNTNMSTKHNHTPTVRWLYPHRTDGGAEYLTDAFVKAPNGDLVGVFEGASYIVRLDGKRPELTVRANAALLAERDALRAALRECITSVPDHITANHRERIGRINVIARAALALSQAEAQHLPIIAPIETEVACG